VTITPRPEGWIILIGLDAGVWFGGLWRRGSLSLAQSRTAQHFFDYRER
jgi:hypothetical protein